MSYEMKRRVTVSLDAGLLDRIDRMPGGNRSEKAEKLIEEALSVRGQVQWVRELAAFYTPERMASEEREDQDWQSLVDEAMARED